LIGSELLRGVRCHGSYLIRRQSPYYFAFATLLLVLYERDCLVAFFPAFFTVLFSAGLRVVVSAVFFTILFPAG